MNTNNLKMNGLLFLLGLLGIIALVPVTEQLLGPQVEASNLTIGTLQIISAIQATVLLLLMVWLGSVFSKKGNLVSPVIHALVCSGGAYNKLKPQITPAIVGGIAGGIFIMAFYTASSSYLPNEFTSTAENLTLPWYARVFYGGITEEILLRWGVMSFFVWGCYRLTQKKNTNIRSHNYVIAIALSALLFGVLHLPAAFALSSEVTLPLVIYVILGNASFGFIAGYLYWKQGLECAIGAHMIAHLTMIVASSLA